MQRILQGEVGNHPPENIQALICDQAAFHSSTSKELRLMVNSQGFIYLAALMKPEQSLGSQSLTGGRRSAPGRGGWI